MEKESNQAAAESDTIEKFSLSGNPEEEQNHPKRIKKEYDYKTKDSRKSRFTWTDNENETLMRVYCIMKPEELEEIFPNHSFKAINEQARRLGCKKTPEYIKEVAAENPSKQGPAHLADVPALSRSYAPENVPN